MGQKSQKMLLFLVGDFVEDYEAMIPYQMALMGFSKNVTAPRVLTVSPGKKEGDTVATAIHDVENEKDQSYTEKRGHNFAINFSWDSLTEEVWSQCDGLYIPGGRAPEYIRLDQKVLEITRWFMDHNKPISAMGHGAQVLTAAKCIKGKKLTSHLHCEPEVTRAGGVYQQCKDDGVVVDGNLVTGVSWLGHAAVMREWLKLIGVTWKQSGKSCNVLMLVGDFVEDYEAMNVCQMLELAGVEVGTISPHKLSTDRVKTSVHDFEGFATYTEKPGHLLKLNMDWGMYCSDKGVTSDINTVDALYIPGGRSPEYLRLNPGVQSLVEWFMSKNKPVATICHGP